VKSEKWATAAALTRNVEQAAAVAHFSLFTFHFSLFPIFALTT
jgi:hypothetical protein